MSQAFRFLLIIVFFVPAAMASERIAAPVKKSGQAEFGIQVTVDQNALGGMQGQRAGTIGPMELPGDLGSVNLHFERLDQYFLDGNSILLIDGEPAGRLGELSGFSAYNVSVEGQPDSSGYLAFSAAGPMGWFQVGGETVHLVPKREGLATEGFLVRDSEYSSRNMGPTLECKLDDVIAQNPGSPPVPFQNTQNQTQTLGGGGGYAYSQGGGGPSPFYNLRMILETDYQFYQIFNNLAAAEGYALALSGAVSCRYREQVGIIITYPYLQLYTSNNDPWTEQDSGGNCIDVLNEFVGAWSGGGAPMSGDLYHMLSGGSLGCGVAYLDVLCNQDWGFAVSGNIDGNVTFPVTQGPLNWDFMVMAHEIGHNVKVPHTHDYCPVPLDECAPSGYFGSCQSQQTCISNGTIMSYCHLCPGGLSNITTYFHPTIVNDMRNEVHPGGCLAPFEGVFTTDLGNALDGSNGTPNLVISYTDGPDTLNFDVTGAPVSSFGLHVIGFSTVYAPFLGGGTLVPNWDLTFNGGSDALGETSFSGTVGSFPDGVTAIVQSWYVDGGGPNGFAATNGVEFELITP